MLYKRCNTDVLGVLLIYPHSPPGAARPQDCAYVSVKPLAAVLQPISVVHDIHVIYATWAGGICLSLKAHSTQR